ncbi:MAG: SEC-C domain-containing protein [Planctomycetaceae bacterium]|nr:SEC-C domain-containing protein [Planctomycetaceae bacterium]
MVADAAGRKRYDREGLVQWASDRFGTQLELDDLKNMQRDEIRDLLFETCVIPKEKYQKKREELRRDFLELLEAQNTTREDLENHLAVIDRYNPKLEEFCRKLKEDYNYIITPYRTALWRAEELEDHLDAVIEDWFNPEMRKMERSLVLQILDAAWKDHLLVMDHLRSSVGLRGYAQVDPKVEYKREGMRIFETMWSSVFDRVTDLIFRMEQLDEGFVSSTWTESEARHDEISGMDAVDDVANQQQSAIEEQQSAIEGTQSAIEGTQSDEKLKPIRNRTKRCKPNDPCPCGSGKKYKNCCKE